MRELRTTTSPTSPSPSGPTKSPCSTWHNARHIAAMDSGGGEQHNPGSHQWDVVNVGSGSMITYEQWRENHQRIARYRQYLDQVARQNDEAYQRWAVIQQELQNRVEQGREAE